jgi:aminocarboxymuconate-semialdehyde decarboxylase
MTPYGVIGTLFARGTINSAALIALVEGGVFSELPNLRVVVTAHAIGGLAMLAGLSHQSRLPSDTIEAMRKHVFIDTTLVQSALIRAAVDLLGAGNVLAGSDWPIAGENPVRGPLTEAMQHAGLSEDEQNAIAAGNCMRLLTIGGVAAGRALQ